MSSPSTPGEPRTGQQLYHAAPFTPATAAKLTAAAIGAIYCTQMVLVIAGLPVLLAGVGGYLVAIVALWRYAVRRGLGAESFGLRRVPPRFVVAAVLIGIAMWYLTAIIVTLLNPPGDTSKLEKVVEQTALAPTLIALTIFPAVAEELVFRGVLARGLAERWPRGAIVISAAVFGAYHVFPPQVVSTFVLGLVLAFLTLRARSIVPTIIVHTLNNTIAVLLSRDEIPGVKAWFEVYGLAAAFGAGALVLAGLALAAKGAP